MTTPERAGVIGGILAVGEICYEFSAVDGFVHKGRGTCLRLWEF